MDIFINIGEDKQALCVPDDNLIGILKSNSSESYSKEVDIVADALRNPIGTGVLSEVVRKGEKIVIITSDITRPCPSYKILPSIFKEMEENDIDLNDITVVFALGSHRSHTEKEMKKLVGETVYSRVSCMDGDPNDVVHMGTTKNGTPVDITRIVAQADRRICIGNIDYHYFAGYSGGAKAIMPGVSTRNAIQKNHCRMVDPMAKAGCLDENPVRKDLEEAIEHCPIDFILNVILDEKKNIVHAVAGHYNEAHREGCRFLDSFFGSPIDSKADIVVVSQGGAPKDMNLYQTQKALDNAKHAVKEGGIIILVGSCEEGFGEGVFEDWLKTASDPKCLIKRIKDDFQLGGHKAAAIAMVLEKNEIYFVSKMDPGIVSSIFMKPYDTVQEAFDDAFGRLGDKAEVIIMPFGGATLPILAK